MEKEPIEQGVGGTMGVGQKLPAGHPGQSNAFSNPNPVEYVPLGHAEGLRDPGGQYAPSGHSNASDMPMLSHK